MPSYPTQPIGNYPPLVSLDALRPKPSSQSSGDAMRAMMQMRRQQEAEQRRLEENATQQLLQFASDPDANLDSVAPSIPNLSMKGYKLAVETQRLGKARRKREEEIAGANTALGGAARLGAGRVNEQGQVVVSPENAALAKRTKEKALATVGAQRPGLVNQTRALFDLSRAIATQELQAQATGVRAQQQDEEIDNWATRYAGQAMGVLRQEDIEGEIRERYGPEQAPGILAQVVNQGKAELVSRKLMAASPAGRSEFDRKVWAYRELYGYSEAEAIAVVDGKGFDDPVTGKLIIGMTSSQKEKRYALNELINSVPDLREAATDAARAGAERGAFIGPALGTPAIQDMTRFFGIQDPAVANYELQYRNFTSRMLKAIQGSRPSDFDLRFYLGLMPMLTELWMTPEGTLNPAAEQRLATMEKMLRTSAETPFDKKLGAQARRLRGIDRRAPTSRHPEGELTNPEDRAIQAALEAYSAGTMSLEEFTGLASKWKQSRGSRFIPDSVRTGPASTDPLDLYLRE